MNTIKNLNFYSVKDLVKRMKRQVTSWEKVISNHISNKGLVSRIYNQFSKLNRKNNQINQFFKRSKNMNTKEDTQMVIST